MGVRVLVVDDEKSIRFTFREFLKEAGYDVSLAEDAKEALALLGKAPFDVVITDIILPQMNGVMLLHAIRDAAPRAQVIMMTGEPTVETASEALRAGATDYLFKPLNKDVLLKAVATAARIKKLDDERYRLEEENEEYRKHLESLVEKRTLALEESRKSYHELLESLQEGIWAVDTDGKTTFANSYMAETLGYAPEEMIGLPYSAFSEENPFAQGSIQWQESAAGVHEGLLRRKDGSTLLAQMRISQLHDIDGHSTGAMASVIDITLHRQLEQDRLRLAMAVEQTGEAILVTDATGIIRYANPAFLQLTRYDWDEVIGLTPRFLKSDQHPPSFYENLWSTITEGKVWIGHFVNKRKDGALFETEATISPVISPSGQIINFVAVERDVTQRLLLEQQLRQAQKMEAIGQLAGGVAHDFNNILQAVLGYSSMLLERLPAEGELYAFVEEISNGADRASALTRQLLAFSRRQVLKMEDLDLNEVIQSLMKMLKRVIGEDIKVNVLAGYRLGTIHADRGQMEQMLMNLCVNARDAMTEGGTLSIETENVVLDDDYCGAHAWAQPGRYVLLSVTDTGCGMTSEIMGHIFEPFFTTKDVGKGTGLGLATVYGIVKQHQGTIQAYSEVGRGTIFKVYLPIIERNASAVSNKILGNPSGGTETLVLAEDDDAVRNLVARVLTQAGYTVLTASNGKEVLRIFEECAHPIELVLLDLVMPELSGHKVYDILREKKPCPRFLFSSGYSTNALHAGFELDAGFELIQKPYSSDTLLRKIREILDRN